MYTGSPTGISARRDRGTAPCCRQRLRVRVCYVTLALPARSNSANRSRQINRLFRLWLKRHIACSALIQTPAHPPTHWYRPSGIQPSRARLHGRVAGQSVAKEIGVDSCELLPPQTRVRCVACPEDRPAHRPRSRQRVRAFLRLSAAPDESVWLRDARHP